MYSAAENRYCAPLLLTVIIAVVIQYRCFIDLQTIPERGTRILHSEQTKGFTSTNCYEITVIMPRTYKYNRRVLHVSNVPVQSTTRMDTRTQKKSY